MSEDPKVIVERAYDHIADWYVQWVTGQRSLREKYANKVLAACSSPSPPILELGCGPGVPITRMLLDRGAHVVANDISATQIHMARARCPEATFVRGDMAGLAFEPASFEGAVCFFTIFHLPRAEQRSLLSRIYSWLRPGGMFVVNFAVFDEEEIYGEMMGHGIFWSGFGVEESKAMLTGVGFELVEAEEGESGDGRLEEGDADYGSVFAWIAAKKPSGI